MDIQLRPGYMLQLTRDEIRIIGLALSGKLWEPITGKGPGPKLAQEEDQKKALEMNRQMVQSLSTRYQEQQTHWAKICSEVGVEGETKGG